MCRLAANIYQSCCHRGLAAADFSVQSPCAAQSSSCLQDVDPRALKAVVSRSGFCPACLRKKAQGIDIRPYRPRRISGHAAAAPPPSPVAKPPATPKISWRQSKTVSSVGLKTPTPVRKSGDWTAYDLFQDPTTTTTTEIVTPCKPRAKASITFLTPNDSSPAWRTTKRENPPMLLEISDAKKNALPPQPRTPRSSPLSRGSKRSRQSSFSSCDDDSPVSKRSRYSTATAATTPSSDLALKN